MRGRVLTLAIGKKKGLCGLAIEAGSHLVNQVTCTGLLWNAPKSSAVSTIE